MRAWHYEREQDGTQNGDLQSVRAEPLNSVTSINFCTDTPRACNTFLVSVFSADGKMAKENIRY